MRTGRYSKPLSVAQLLTKNPPYRASHQNQAAGEGRDDLHAWLSKRVLASWIVWAPSSR